MSESQSAGDAVGGDRIRRRGSLCCQVVGCTADLHTQAKPAYCLKRRLCHQHIKADAVKRRDSGPELWRYCFQCGKLEPLALFDGARRNCRASLQQRRKASRAKTGTAGATRSHLGCDSQDVSLLRSPQSPASDITLVQPQHQGVLQASSCVNLAGLLPGSGSTCTPPASCNTAEDGLFDIQEAAAELAAAYCGAEEFSGQQLQMAQAQQQEQEQATLCQMLQVELAAAGQLPDTQDTPTPAAVFASPSMMAVPAPASFAPASAAGTHLSSMAAGNVPAGPLVAAVGLPQHGDAFFNQLLNQLLGEINAPTQQLARATSDQLRASQAMALPAVGITPRRDLSAAQAHVWGRIAMLEQQCQKLAGTLQALQVLAQQGLL